MCVFTPLFVVLVFLLLLLRGNPADCTLGACDHVDLDIRVVVMLCTVDISRVS